MPKSGWKKEDVPSQVGKLVVITGTGGLGYETALVLAEKGATIILAGRNEAKGQESCDKIKAAVPDAKITFEKLDLGSLASVAEFGSRFNSEHEVLDLLINNAGVMMPGQREKTQDGFELQFGTNHLGHFALTSHLLPALRRSSAPRVVNVSSGAHRYGKINFDDLQWEKSYDQWGSYGQSKLANLLFTLEFQRRSDEGRWGVMCNSSHPGFARTDLISNMEQNGNTSFKAKMMEFIKPYMSQSAADGALPTLYGATSPEAKGGAYYGPDGCFEMKGAPKEATRTDRAKDEETAKQLWDVSNTLTGVTWP